MKNLPSSGPEAGLSPHCFAVCLRMSSRPNGSRKLRYRSTWVGIVSSGILGHAYMMVEGKHYNEIRPGAFYDDGCWDGIVDLSLLYPYRFIAPRHYVSLRYEANDMELPSAKGNAEQLKLSVDWKGMYDSFLGETNARFLRMQLEVRVFSM